jgi:biofilm PGA synthesis protein PgaD
MTGAPQDSLIIERPDLQSWPALLGSRLVTAIMWVLYVYLWLPLVTLIGWAFGIDAAYRQMIELGGYQVVVSLWIFFAAVIVIMGGALLTWARVNLYRFRGRDRRSAPGLTDRARMAADFGLSAEQLQLLQACRRAALSHDPDGSLRHVRIGYAHQSTPTAPGTFPTTEPMPVLPGPAVQPHEPSETAS